MRRRTVEEGHRGPVALQADRGGPFAELVGGTFQRAEVGGLVVVVLQLLGVELVEAGEVAVEAEAEGADLRMLASGFVEVGPVEGDDRGELAVGGEADVGGLTRDLTSGGGLPPVPSTPRRIISARSSVVTSRPLLILGRVTGHRPGRAKARPRMSAAGPGFR